MSRKWSVPVAVATSVLMAVLLLVLAISDKDECATGFRGYSLTIGLPQEPPFILAASGQQVTSVSVRGCIPDTPEVTDEVVDQAVKDVVGMTVTYNAQVRQFQTKEQTLFFFSDLFVVLIEQKYRLFFKTKNTALEFDLKTKDAPPPTPKGLTA